MDIFIYHCQEQLEIPCKSLTVPVHHIQEGFLGECERFPTVNQDSTMVASVQSLSFQLSVIQFAESSFGAVRGVRARQRDTEEAYLVTVVMGVAPGTEKQRIGPCLLTTTFCRR